MESQNIQKNLEPNTEELFNYVKKRRNPFELTTPKRKYLMNNPNKLTYLNKDKITDKKLI